VRRSARGSQLANLAWAVGIPRHLKVYPADVRMIWPVARRGRPRQRDVPEEVAKCGPFQE
jgi:hypothetical protein